jgi:Rrf2 family iron-sulfur cluster assembly transcriptional regulator
MKLGTKGRYAVMAMVDVAKNGKGGSPISLSDISSRQEISLSYLEQLFCKLRKANLVSSTRGVLGGYLLSRSPSHISIAEIIHAAEEPIQLTRCRSKSVGCMKNQARCLTHHLWESIGHQITNYLAKISLEDIVDNKSLKDFPQENTKQKIYAVSS